MFPINWFVILMLSVAAILSVKARKLTPLGGLSGGIISMCIFFGYGYTGIIILATFFLCGTLATSWRLKQKQQNGLAEKNKGRRTAGQVIANAGVAALLGVLVVAMPSQADLLQSMLAATFASATADTLSSELGNVYGRKYYNIITFRRDTRGLDGVISVEGTLIGIGGAGVIAFIHLISGHAAVESLQILIAGTLGNVADSVLGATLQRKKYLNNDTVNFLNTAIAATLVYIFSILG